ncbi:MAG: HU family DNA-binding protein [Treponema sp.]|nr:HU family DNA-binding protein [Treponema sp.]
MTRSDLIKAITDTVAIDKKKCGDILSALLEELYVTLENDGKYTQTGFGTFDTRVYSERVGRNPFTKQKVRYPKKRKMRFKPAKLLKDTLNAE